MYSVYRCLVTGAKGIAYDGELLGHADYRTDVAQALVDICNVFESFREKKGEEPKKVLAAAEAFLFKRL